VAEFNWERARYEHMRRANERRHKASSKVKQFGCRECGTTKISNARTIWCFDGHDSTRMYRMKSEPCMLMFQPAILRSFESDPRDRKLDRPRHKASDVCTAPLVLQS
jgi:hypothetical protein